MNDYDIDDTEIKLTKAEARAIARLQKLAAKWPRSLLLFSQAGRLLVLKPPKEDLASTLRRYTVAKIDGIRNDGGDSDY